MEDQCDECGKFKEDVKCVIDPYLKEVEHRTEFRYLCETCYRTREDDI